MKLRLESVRLAPRLVLSDSTVEILALVQLAGGNVARVDDIKVVVNMVRETNAGFRCTLDM